MGSVADGVDIDGAHAALHVAQPPAEGVRLAERYFENKFDGAQEFRRGEFPFQTERVFGKTRCFQHTSVRRGAFAKSGTDILVNRIDTGVQPDVEQTGKILCFPGRTHGQFGKQNLFLGKLLRRDPEGFRPEEYVEIQALPDAYIYKVGLQCIALWAGALLASFLLARLDNGSRWRSVGLTAVCLLGAIGLGRYSLPDTLDIQNRMADEVAYLARERQWDALARRFRGKEMRDYISLNYLNMALAQKGQLAESMFTFDQRGTKSLVTPWNQTFFVSKMLCDVHFHIGDLALAESYAMDAMAQAKRGGSAWMLRRLAQINLLRGEWEVARKYIRLLAEMPLYRDWARKAESYIGHPERMENDPELRGKTLPPTRTDNLFGLMTTEALWSSHPAGSIGWEYLGCHYLLAKDLPGFRAFIEASGARELPRHFQEAWLIANDTPDSSALHPAIRPEIARRYEQLRKLLSIRSASDVDMRAVYQTFGDTYWFDYYFKIFQDPTNTNAR